MIRLISLDQSFGLEQKQTNLMLENSLVNVIDHGEGIFCIKVTDDLNKNLLSETIILGLEKSFTAIRKQKNAKAVLLMGGEQWFLSSNITEKELLFARKTLLLPLDCDVPVIAVMKGQSTGLGWLIGALCDFMICSKESSYQYFSQDVNWQPCEEELFLFEERFDKEFTSELLFSHKSYTGIDLREKGLGMPILSKDEIDSYALAFARQLVEAPIKSVKLLKKHLSQGMTLRANKLLSSFTSIPKDRKNLNLQIKNDFFENQGAIQGAIPDLGSPKNIKMNSDVVRLQVYPNKVVLVTLCDKENKNTFSNSFVEGVKEAFEKIEGNSEYKVVILTGYDHYFACGGTKEGLIAIQKGETKFTDVMIYSLPLECKIPVIAVMQGHGIGAGWSMGMFCDHVLFSKESVYLSPYMRYGFTPGAGSTLVFPKKFGMDLGREILFTAKEYKSDELRLRGVKMPVLPRADIQDYALKMASKMALSSREELVNLKTSRCIDLRNCVSEIYDQELAMHEKSFVNNEEVFQRIQNHFNEKIQTTKEIAQIKILEVSHIDTDEAVLERIQEKLRVTLAEELFMTKDMIDDDLAFIEMGLDSIIGVTWVRKINAEYGLSIAATKVYNYPTIAQFAKYVMSEGQKNGLFKANNKTHDDKKIESLQIEITESSKSETVENIFEEIRERLRMTLAEELYMTKEMIDDDLAFIEMGLDSIIGVTWIRKINAEYGLSIAATKVYNYPTIAQFTKYVMSEVQKHGLFKSNNKTQEDKKIDSLQIKNPEISNSESDENISKRIRERLRMTLAEELYMTKEMLEDDLAFIEMGLDSIIGVTWIRKINAEYGLSIAATKVYSHPTIAQFTKYLLSEGKKQGLFQSSSQEFTISKTFQEKALEPTRKENQKTTYPTLTSLRAAKLNDKTQILNVETKGLESKNQTQAIAVIGMSGEFPKSKTLEEFWENLIHGRDCISDIPPSRWDINEYYDPNPQAPGKTHCKWMGVLEDAAQFDPLFFNISPSEAELMDPQQRVFLQSIWHCIEDSTYSPSQLSGSRCGVFVGCGVGDYARLLKNEELSAKGFTGGSTSILAARISYLLNLQGPCISIDTACSSSLVAIASACDSLVLGNSDLALAGGVCVLAGPSVHIMASKAGMLSEDGHCYSFDQRANGFVPGEGVGVVFLKRLEDAERDKDQIHAVIRGWGVNQDGKTNGITAPNPDSQARLEQEIYDKFGINPESIQLVETHGTGTKLGDPIEIEGLQKSFKSYTSKENYCAIGSVKSNIGHLLTAAGIAGTIKLLLSLKYKKIPPTIHHDQLNEHIKLEKSPFYINTESKDWLISEDQKRRCALSSFGFSGTNAHIIIEEYIADKSQTLQKPVIVNSLHPAIIVLSAKNQMRLTEYAKSLLKFIQNNPKTNLANLAYTFQVGREAMDERLGLIVSSMHMLEEKLQAFIEGNKEVNNLYRGQVKQDKASLKVFTEDNDMANTIDIWIAQGKYSQLLDLWVKGLNLDWNRLYQNNQPQRISAPLYPFAKERYWADTQESSTTVETTLTMKTHLHPLLHENTSNFNEQRFCSTFNGTEFFLRDHQVEGKKVLPGVAYLEMAQAALSQSLVNLSKNNEYIALKNVVWARPLAVIEPTKLTIGLFPSKNGEISYEIFTDNMADEGNPVIYSQGVALVCSSSDTPKLNLVDLQIKLNKSQLNRQECYEIFSNIGLNYGPAHQCIDKIYVGEKGVLAQLSLPFVLANTKNLFKLHPSLLDAALQASIVLSFNEKKHQLSLPFALDRLDILHTCTESMWAWVRYSEKGVTSDKIQKVDIDLCTEDGLVCIKIRGFSARVLEPTLLDKPISKVITIDSVEDLSIYSDKELINKTNAFEDVPTSVRESGFDISEELDEKVIKEKVNTYFKKQLSKVLKLPIQQIQADEPFEKYGIDSIVVMQLTNELEKTFGSLSKTLFFEYQTIEEISEYFLMSYRSNLIKILDIPSTKKTAEKSDAALQKLLVPKKVSSPIHRSRSGNNSTNPIVPHEVTPIDIAIIGLSGKYPQSENLEEYWHNLREGKDCIIEVPKERWDWKDYYTEDRSEPGRHYSKWGGFIKDVDKFDPLFFNISPREAQFIDPQERLFLEHVWMALEDAGYTRNDLQGMTTETLGGQVGVYAGVMYGHYQLFGAEENLRGNPVSLGNSYASIANRVSYFLNLHGPSMAIDTMCSSSLTTLHLACQDLKLGRTNLGIVGGVNLSIHPNKYLDLSMGQFISSKGRCESFGEGGEGYIPGEGIGVALVKRLSDAKRDGDHIYGIIKGSMLNHGGKTNGYTVPNPKAQQEVIARALKESQIHPEMISYIETHGTGTKLGDPIEITGLTKAFAFKELKPHCWIGSAKSNIGHCESAAGIAGVTKVLLQMKNKQIVPSLHSKVLNPNIDFSNTPFIVNQELRDWERPIIDGNEYPRIAGISSFGAGGSNAHLVIEEYIPDDSQQEPVVVNSSQPAIFVLSAKNQTRLTEYAKSLLKFIQNNPKTNLANLAYTFQVGREAMEERLGLIIPSMQTLEEKLQEFIEGKEEVDNLFRGNAKQNKETLTAFTSDDDMVNIIDTWIAKGKSSKLLELWVKGLNFDWNLLYQGNKSQRISAPTYPFAKERYWVDTKNSSAISTETAPKTHLHPLLHENTSNLSVQRFCSTLTGTEFFLKDHQVHGQKVLPGVAYLEMAQAAVGQSLDDLSKNHESIALKNVVWARPLNVNEPTKVKIDLFPSENGEIGYEIYTNHVDESNPVVHSQGVALLYSVTEEFKLNLTDLQIKLNRSLINGQACYETFDSMGLNYGPAHQGIDRMYIGENEVLAKLKLPSVLTKTKNQFILHPSLLDAALQASIGLSFSEKKRQLSLPFALDRLETLNACTDSMWAWVRYAEVGVTSDKVQKLDIDLCDENGLVCIKMRGFSSRVFDVMPLATSPRTSTLMFKPIWTASPINFSEDIPKLIAHQVFLCGLNQNSEQLQIENAGMSFISLQSNQTLIEKRFVDYSVDLFEHVRTLLADKPKGPVLLQVVVPDQGPERLFSSLSGLLKSAHLENPKILGQVIMVDTESVGKELIAKLQESSKSPQEQQILYKQGKRFVMSFAEEISFQADAQVKREIPWRDEGIYLITGGAGGLGLLFVQEIAEQTKHATVVVTGRSKLTQKKQSQLDALKSLGVRIEYKKVDVCDKASVENLIQEIEHEIGQLNGIIHSAGIIKDNFIIKKNKEEFRQVLLPKVEGVVNLDQATQNLKHLDFFILFSSGAGAMGNIGQADYATANAFLDAFSQERQSLCDAKKRSGQTISINWPLWKSGGMSVNQATEQMMRESIGMVPMETMSGMSAFYRALSLKQPQMIVVEGYLPQMREKLLASVKRVHEDLKLSKDPLSAKINTDGLVIKIQNILLQTVSELLKINPSNIDVDTELSEYGFDSISLTEFSNKLNQKYKLELTPTIFFEYSTIDSLATHLSKEYQILFAKQLSTVSQIEPVSTPKNDPNKTPRMELNLDEPTPHSRFSKPLSSSEIKSDISEPIAIVGMSGQFPMARDIDEFWSNLVNEKNCIREIPKERWDWEKIFGDPSTETNKTNIKWGGFIDGVGEFDPLFFNISPREAELMDPQQRLLMTYAWLALEDSAHSASNLSGGNTGIFVGTTSSGYSTLINDAKIDIEGYSSTGTVASMGPNRMSYFLNIHGPSEPIETACSSSLVAIHKAILAIQAGDCDQAIVGGINTIITPEAHISFNKAGMLCQDGRCKTFSKQANGYVRSEGVGMLVLKKLKAAEADRDHIYGLIRGSAQNHGGRANSLTAPNPKAQSELIVNAYKKAGIDPRTVGYIEVHGTGTELGDPIEINGLKTAFKKLYLETGNSQIDRPHCGLGSVKTNIGHLEIAAGVSGVIKVLLQLKHKKLVKSLHCDEMNPYIDLTDSSFYLVNQSQEWEALIDSSGKTLPRRAGVSSFGFGGSNAHIVIEEYIPSEFQKTKESILVDSSNPVMIVLSAKNQLRLHEYAENLLKFVQGNTKINLAELAYTFQVGREAMEERLGFIIHSKRELEEKLQSFIGKKIDTNHFYRGQVKQNKETLAVFLGDEDMAKTIDAWMMKGKYHELLSLWAKGLNFDWNKLYTNNKPQRISAPTYPFSRDLYWVKSDVLQDNKNNFESPLQKTCKNFSMTEQWRVAPLQVETTAWTEKINTKKDHSILVISEEINDYDNIQNICRSIAELSHHSFSINNIEYLPLQKMTTQELDLKPYIVDSDSPQTLFLFLPGDNKSHFTWKGLEMAYACVQSIMHLTTRKQISFFCCHEQPSDISLNNEELLGLFKSAISENPRHRYRSISYDNKLLSGQVALRVIQEWLCDAFTNNILMVHYANEERFEQQLNENENFKEFSQIDQRPLHKKNFVLEKQWKLLSIESKKAINFTGDVLILVNEDSLTLAKQLIKIAAIPEETIIILNASAKDKGQSCNIIDFQNYPSCQQLVKEMLDHVKNITCIIDLSDLYHLPKDKDHDPYGKISFYQEIIASSSPELNILYFTKGLQSFQSKEMSLAGAKFAGLIKMLGVEYRHVRSKAIDIDESYYHEEGIASIIFNELQTTHKETEICYRKLGRFVPYVHKIQVESNQTEKQLLKSFNISQEGVYVISGGTGGIGMKIANYLIEKGAKNLVLMGKTLLPPKSEWKNIGNNPAYSMSVKNKIAAMIALEKKACLVEVYSGDLQDYEAMSIYFEKIRTTMGEIKGVIHCATSAPREGENAVFINKDLKEFRSIYEAKVNGMEHLQMIFNDDPLDFFISFSSTAGQIPYFMRGLSSYGMANSYLDYFTNYQVFKGKSYYRSIAWVGWTDVGMNKHNKSLEATQRYARKLGLLFNDSKEGIELFESAMMINCQNHNLLPCFLDETCFNTNKLHFYTAVNSDELLAMEDNKSICLQINAFENGQLSKGQFAKFLKTLTDSDYTESIQQKIIQAIKLKEGKCGKDLNSESTNTNGRPIFSHPQLLQKECATKEIKEIVEKSFSEQILEELEKVLKIKKSDFDWNQSFQDYGLDSISGIQLATRLEKKFNCPVQPRWFIEHSTLNLFTQKLSQESQYNEVK